MKKLILLLSVMAILFIGCKKEEANSDPASPVSTDLDGYWNSGSIVVHIQGTEGTFYQINQGDWKKAWEAGFVSIGSVKFTNITPLKADKLYQGQNLWWKSENGVVTAVAFSGMGEFNLRNNGNTLYVNTISPWGSDWSKVEYTRVYY